MKETININALSELSGGDNEFVKEILQLFVENTPAELKKMKKHLDDNNAKELAEVLHKMKSYSAPLGLEQMRLKIYNLESNLKSKDALAIKDEVDEFVLFMENLIENTNIQITHLNS